MRAGEIEDLMIKSIAASVEALPSTHMVVHSCLDLQSQEIRCTFLASTGTRYAYGVWTFMQKNTHVQKIKKSN